MDPRRVVDLTFGTAALAISAPILAGAALAMRMSGDRDAFLYRAPRVGEDGRQFMILKVRTMAEHSDGPAITLSGDRRVTRVGRALRHFRIDELPQVVNVLRGEMSLVGPRPEDPAFVDFTDPVHNRVFRVRPGITGLAQLVYHNEADHLSGPDAERVYRERILPAKLSLDCEYLDHRSVWLDLQIMARTMLAVLR